jgi:hypothetical protein
VVAPRFRPTVSRVGFVASYGRIGDSARSITNSIRNTGLELVTAVGCSWLTFTFGGLLASMLLLGLMLIIMIFLG